MPKITEITVSAGRVLPHPHENYANLRPMISLKATIGEGEDVSAVTASLQGFAEGLLQMHILFVETQIEAEHQAKVKRQEEEYERRKLERAARVPVSEIMDDDDDDDNLEHMS